MATSTSRMPSLWWASRSWVPGVAPGNTMQQEECHNRVGGMWDGGVVQGWPWLLEFTILHKLLKERVAKHWAPICSPGRRCSIYSRSPKDRLPGVGCSTLGCTYTCSSTTTKGEDGGPGAG